jgi:hypothetical protein
LGLSDCINGHIGCNCNQTGDCTNDLLGAPPVPIDFGNFWDNQSHVGIGGGNFGGVATFNVFQTFSVETDVTTTETNIDGSFGSDFLTYFLMLPTVGGGGEDGHHNKPPRLNCNPTTGICVPVPPPGPSPLKKLVKWYLCGKGPLDNFRNWTVEGTTKGVFIGAGGGVFLGGPPGSVLGAVGGGVEGFFLGAAGGVIATGGCSFAGAYQP